MPANGKLAAEMLAPSKTKTYVPSRSVVSGYAWYDDEHGPLTYWDIERMLRGDGHVRFCLNALAAPILRATWTVYARSQEVAKFADSQIKQFWEQDLRNIIPSKFAWGTRGGEKIFTKNHNRHIVLERMKVIHPFDARPLQLNGEWWGVEITGLETGVAILNKVKSFWFAHKDEYGTLYGQSCLHPVRPIWQEKRDPKGAVPSRRAWFGKYAFRGGVMYVPRGGEIDPQSGKEISYMDNAQQMMEFAEAGATFVLLDIRDEKGNRLWEYVDPTGNDHPPLVIDYVKELDKEISRAIGLSPEILEATGETGSGYKGRFIPLMVFYDQCDAETKQQMRDFCHQVLDPEIKANFGNEPYRVETDSLLPKGDDGDPSDQHLNQGRNKGGRPTEIKLQGHPQNHVVGMSLGDVGWTYASRFQRTYNLATDLDDLALSLGAKLEVICGLEEQLTATRKELASIKKIDSEEMVELGLAGGDTVLIAVYGTLRDGAVRHRALGHSSSVEKATLLNFARAGTAEFPNLIPQQGGQVEVDVFPADRWDIEKLMRYEGQDNYRPERVKVKDRDGGVRDAIVFLLAEGGGTESQQGETPETKANAIAELLSGIYGTSAAQLLGQVDHGRSTSVQMAMWDPNLHPRAEHSGGERRGGEFVPKHGEEAHAIVGDKIKAAMEKPGDAGTMADLLNHLNLLTAKQIMDVAKQHGLASGLKKQGKEQLAKAVYSRLVQGQYQPSMFGEETPGQTSEEEVGKVGQPAVAPQPAAPSPASSAEQPVAQPAPEPKPQERPPISGVSEARKALAAGKLPLKGNASSELITSDASGEPIRRHVVLPGGQKIHPDELHRLTDEGHLGPENIEVKDKHGTMKHLTFPRALAAVTAIKGHDEDRVTLTSPHGYMVTQTRGEWRQAGHKGGSMGSWYDQTAPKVESEAARQAGKGTTIASDEESQDFFTQPVQEQESMFDHKTKALSAEEPFYEITEKDFVDEPRINLSVTVNMPEGAVKVTNQIPEQPAPVVNVTTPDVTVNVPPLSSPVVNMAPARVTVNVPEQKPPVVNVTVPDPKPREITIKKTSDKEWKAESKPEKPKEE